MNDTITFFEIVYLAIQRVFFGRNIPETTLLMKSETVSSYYFKCPPSFQIAFLRLILSFMKKKSQEFRYGFGFFIQ